MAPASRGRRGGFPRRRGRGRARSGAFAAAFLFALPAGEGVAAQQVTDTAFRPELGAPAFPGSDGPRVAIDGGHGNFHTVDGRYAPFARVLRADGFRVSGLESPFGAEALRGVDVLVVANALHPSNLGDWSLPTPSAFSEREIDFVRRWVEEGGALLLVADHMPFPGAAAALASAFGFTLVNGFVFDSAGGRRLVFRSSDGSLARHEATRLAGRVDSVATFTGEAFRIPEGAVSLLTLPDGLVSLQPDTAWAFHDDTPVLDVGGWSQGAVLEVGRGRLAVFGEAAMFSAQRQGAGGAPMGMNAPEAAQNPVFLLGLLRWLAGASSN